MFVLKIDRVVVINGIVKYLFIWELFKNKNIKSVYKKFFMKIFRICWVDLEEVKFFNMWGENWVVNDVNIISIKLKVNVVIDRIFGIIVFINVLVKFMLIEKNEGIFFFIL